MPHRTEKVASVLHKYLAQYLITLELPAMTTVSNVNVSPDLKNALVGITVMPEEREDEVLTLLNSKPFRIQQVIMLKLKTKNIPRVTFVLDYSSQYAQRINDLIRRTHEDV